MESYRLMYVEEEYVVLERYVKEQHLPVYVQKSMPYETREGVVLYEVVLEYPDNFNVMENLLKPVDRIMIEQCYGEA